MNIVGIVAEYNPFHNGHLYHLEKSKQITDSDFVIAVMSPNFVQRGAPALTDKWTRTQMALLSGVDLVIELPTPYACSSAEFFANASVSLLHHTGIVDYISFGSESNNIELLGCIANILNDEPTKFKELLRDNLQNGSTFPKARANALSEYCSSISSLGISLQELKRAISTPNNILGIEYIKALKKLNTNIVPMTLQRTAANYHDNSINGNIASATAIRHHLETSALNSISNTVPSHSYNLLNKTNDQGSVNYTKLSEFLNYRLLFSNKEDLRNIVGVAEGIENRILSVFTKTQTLDEMIAGIKSKRFTQTAIQRILMNIILQITKEDFYSFEDHGGPAYVRVLGFRRSSQMLLAKIKKESSLPLVMNVKRDYPNLSPIAKKMIDIEIRCTNIYSALYYNDPRYNLDLTHPIVII